MHYQSHTIRVDGTSLHMVESGKGRSILLIHGLTNNWEGHIPLASFLEKTHRVCIVDLPGYGDSGRLPAYSVATMANYLYQLIRALRIRPLSVVGLSMGASIVGELVRKYKNIADSAVIIGPVLPDARRKTQTMNYVLRAANRVPKGSVLLKKLVATKLHGYLCAKYLNMYKLDKALIDKYGTTGRKKMTPDAYVQMGISVARYDLAGALLKIRIPTLLLFGREDKISCYQYAEKHLLAANTSLHLAAIPQAGHVVSFEKPRQTAAVITSFLKQHVHA